MSLPLSLLQRIGPPFSLGYEAWVLISWTLLFLNLLCVYSKTTHVFAVFMIQIELSYLHDKTGCHQSSQAQVSWWFWVTWFFICVWLFLWSLGQLCLGILAKPGPSPWSLLVNLICIVFIQYMTDAHRCHIGIQIWTTNMLHTLAYQVIPTMLNCRQFDPNELPPDYWVSCHDLYIGDILFNHYPPAIGQPTADEDEVLHAPPSYPEWYPLAEVNCAISPNQGQLNRKWVVRPSPFGLPNGPRGCRWGNTCPQGIVLCLARVGTSIDSIDREIVLRVVL